MQNLNESSLTRIQRLFSDPERRVGIITAFRGKIPIEMIDAPAPPRPSSDQESIFTNKKKGDNKLIRTREKLRDLKTTIPVYFKELSEKDQEDPAKVAQHAARRAEAIQQARLKENRMRNRKLLADLRSRGFGVEVATGYYPETVKDPKTGQPILDPVTGDPLTIDVEEESFIVSSPRRRFQLSNEGFAAMLHELGNKYDQDSVLVKDEDGAALIHSNGEREHIGKFSANKAGAYYTRMRGRGGRPFLFESVTDVRAFFSKVLAETLS